MTVQILMTHYRYQMPNNQKVLKIVKKIQKRYYNTNPKTWYLPIGEYQSFNDQLSDPFLNLKLQNQIYQDCGINQEIG